MPKVRFRAQYERVFIPKRLPDNVLPSIFFFKPNEVDSVDLAAQDANVRSTGIFIERIKADRCENNGLEKICDWQAFVSRWMSQLDSELLGEKNGSANARSESTVAKGVRRVHEMQACGMTAAYKCVADAGGVGITALYCRFDELQAVEVVRQNTGITSTLLTPPSLNNVPIQTLPTL